MSDFWLWLRLGRDWSFGGLDCLRVWPYGNLDSSSITISILSFFSQYFSVEFSAGLLTILLLSVFSFFSLCSFAFFSRNGSLLNLAVFSLIVPTVAFFGYYDSHLFELAGFSIAVFCVLWFFGQLKKSFMRVVSLKDGFLTFFSGMLGISFSYYVLTEVFSSDRLGKWLLLKGFGVSELQTIFYIPVRFLPYVLFAAILVMLVSDRWKKTKCIPFYGLPLLLGFFVVFSIPQLLTSSQDGLYGLENSVPPGSLVIDWWHHGYQWQYGAGAHTVWDGGTMLISQGSFVGKILLDKPENVSGYIQELAFKHSTSDCRRKLDKVFLVVDHDIAAYFYQVERVSGLNYTRESLTFRLLADEDIHCFEFRGSRRNLKLYEYMCDVEP